MENLFDKNILKLHSGAKKKKMGQELLYAQKCSRCLDVKTRWCARVKFFLYVYPKDVITQKEKLHCSNLSHFFKTILSFFF